MNTLISPHLPGGSKPPGDDDPTGVRDLLSSLPEPEPMPKHLIERINASLAAEQAHRETRFSVAPAPPLRAALRRRQRVLFAVAGAAAAVALIMFAAASLFTSHQPSAGISAAARIGRASGAPAAGGAAPTGAGNGAPEVAAGPVSPTHVQISMTGTHYTQADFVAQARTLLSAPLQPATATESSAAGPTATSAGLLQCLTAIGAGGAQTVRADLSLYQGRPATIIVATTNGTPMAYAVGRQCTRTNAALLQSATPLS